MTEIFHMSGYGVYVWTSMGIVMASLFAIAWRARLRFKQIQARAQWSQDAQQ